MSVAMLPPQLAPFHILLNSSSGFKQAGTVFERTLLPLLNNLEANYTLWETQAEGDGARVGREIARLKQAKDEQLAAQRPSGVKVVVLGGVGTSYELINGFFLESATFVSTGLTATSSTVAVIGPSAPAQYRPPTRKLELEIVPLPPGTANALSRTITLGSEHQATRSLARRMTTRVNGTPYSMVDLLPAPPHDGRGRYQSADFSRA